MVVRFSLLMILISSLILSCTSEQTKEDEESSDKKEASETTVSESQGNSRKFVMSSPIEMAALLQKSGVDFSQEILNPTANVDNYLNTYQKAINLGVYGADLGFINIYGEFGLIPTYLEVVTKLSDDLKIGHFIEHATIKRLANSSDQLDSILYITTKSYEDLNKYLKETRRNNIRILILIGGWIESMHIATHVLRVEQIQEYFESHPILINRIGIQKLLLDEIINEISAFKDNSEYQSLVTKLEGLKELYQHVTISHNAATPEIKEEGNAVRIIDKSTTTIDIQPEDLEKIISKVKEIRNMLISF